MYDKYHIRFPGNKYDIYERSQNKIHNRITHPIKQINLYTNSSHLDTCSEILLLLVETPKAVMLMKILHEES